MRVFLDKDFLLESETAKVLYHDYASKMPIIDYHCHIIPGEILENRRFENITQAWLGGDHYKWRMMRTLGVDERFITGNAPDREKFQKFVEVLPRCPGNPVYHWSHLELQRYFDCNLVINPKNADEIWALTLEKLKGDGFSVRQLIARSNVKAISTTDDPVDDLSVHKALMDDSTNTLVITPTMRPDNAINIDKPGFAEYIRKLADASGKNITTVKDLKEALLRRIEFFGEMGCRASDHGLDYVTCRPAAEDKVEEIFQIGLSGQAVTEEETEVFKTNLMLFFGREFAKRGWVMQLHYGAHRSNSDRMKSLLGPDTGFDSISTKDCSLGLARFLNALDKDGELPKTIIYSLNPNDNAMIGSIIGCFQGDGMPGKMQHGSAWWFNDTKTGMENQLMSLAELGALGTFVGMLTDSRSFLSYTRHEYFRRVLCNMLGNMVQGGLYPADIEELGAIVEDISYCNTARYFGY